MKKTFVLIAILIIVAAALYLYEQKNPFSGLQADDSQVTEEGVTEAVTANNQFAINLFQDLSKQESGNLFFSPYSISTALSMTYEGARGQTAEEIAHVFGLSEDATTRQSSMAALYNRLNQADAQYQLQTANALWVQKDYSLLDSFVQTVKQFYVGNASLVDFQNDTESARQTINNWVEDKTNNKIVDLFPQGTLTADSRLVLTNAIYFKGDWLTPFKTSNTQEELFTISTDQSVQVQLMHQTDDDAKFRYFEDEGLQVLEMPYKGEDLSLLVFLPENNDPTALIKSFTLDNYNQALDNLQGKQVDVYFPKFKLNEKYDLNDNLTSLGMPTAFVPPSDTSGADFSGISEGRDLYIDLVIHQSFVQVDEKGTEAAAATGVGFKTSSVEEPEEIPIFRADHPFVFVIQDKQTGMILFMGLLVNPSIT